MLENERGMVIGVGDDEEMSGCKRNSREKKGRKQEEKAIVFEV